jgi:hypothetical protein
MSPKDTAHTTLENIQTLSEQYTFIQIRIDFNYSPVPTIILFASMTLSTALAWLALGNTIKHRNIHILLFYKQKLFSNILLNDLYDEQGSHESPYRNISDT